MVVLLPRRIQGLAALEKRLSAGWLGRTMKSLRRTKVKVSLPRFKTTSAFMLGKTLTEMGMHLAFSPGADFSGQ